MLFCPNGSKTSSSWISIVDKTVEQSLRAYCPNIPTVNQLLKVLLFFFFSDGHCIKVSSIFEFMIGGFKKGFEYFPKSISKRRSVLKRRGEAWC